MHMSDKESTTEITPEEVEESESENQTTSENENDENIGKIVDNIEELKKLNLELCNLEDFNIENHSSNNDSSEEGGVPQCVQQ